MLNQKLSQKLLQKLSPQQIQLMKLLQVPGLNLEQRIKEEMEINPALEEGREEDAGEESAEGEEETAADQDERNQEDLDLTDYMSDDEVADYKINSYGYVPDDDSRSATPAAPGTFHESLIQQLGLLKMEEREALLAKTIIGNIDDDGYLRRQLEAIVDDVAFAHNITATTAELEELLKKIHGFDPPGVGARDLQECLLIQLERKESNSPSLPLAKRILRKHFDAFTRKLFDKLQKDLGISEGELKEALSEILRLNPKPGGNFAGDTAAGHYITPDFIVTNENGELTVTLNNRNAPELRISASYRDMIREYDRSGKKDPKKKQALTFIKQKIDSARWFIEAIRQRHQTLLLTMQAIVERQKEYFLTGDESRLRPMILKDISERTGLDMSTISRVTSNKHVQTEYGTLPLKFFFSESMMSESGEEVSTREIKQALKELIEQEDKKKPHSDDALKALLKEQGFNVARRTVTKYREQMNVPVARLRKEL